MVFKAGLKVGQMTRTIWITWVTFLVGQVGLICKPYYLDMTQIAITCSLESCWHLVSEYRLWVWWMHWNIIGVKPAYYLKLFWRMWCPKISSLKVCAKAKNEEIYGIDPYKNFHVMLHYSYFSFERKLQHVVCDPGHIRIVLWVSGSTGATSLKGSCTRLYKVSGPRRILN